MTALAYQLINSLLWATPFLRALGFFLALPLPKKIFSPLYAAVFAMLFLSLEKTATAPMTAVFVVSEVLLGFLLAAPALLIYLAAGLFGTVSESLRGQNVSLFFDRANGVSSPALSQICQHYVRVMLIIAGVTSILLPGLAESLSLVPLGELSLSTLKGASMGVLRLAALLFTRAMIMALPLAGMAMALDAFSMLVGRWFPGVSLTSEFISFRTALSVVLLWLLFERLYIPSLLPLLEPRLLLSGLSS